MKTSGIIALIVLIVIIISFATVWYFPSMQDFMESNNRWNGIKSFVSDFAVKNINSFELLKDATANDVLITIPYLNYTPIELSQMKTFVNNGGTLILLDDFGFGNVFLEYIESDIRFDKGTLEDPLFNYKNKYLPKITDFSLSLQNAGIKVLGFNHASALLNVKYEQTLAWSSKMSFIDSNNDGKMNNNEQNGPLAVAAEFRYGMGRIELVSDPSLLINTMVSQNDNKMLVRYLIHEAEPVNNIYYDQSHQTKSPFDASKIRLQQATIILSNPYMLVGVIALLFVIIIYLFRRGIIVG
jgi:hypothetical protein